MAHGLNCACALCSARRSYLDCAARIIQRRIRLFLHEHAQVRTGDCYLCTICTLPQGECDSCREC